MRRLVSCHHLTGIGEDGGGKEPEGIDTCVTKRETHKWDKKEGMCLCKPKTRLLRNNHLNADLNAGFDF